MPCLGLWLTSWHGSLGAVVTLSLCNVSTVLRRISIEELTALIETPLNDSVSCVIYEDECKRGMSDNQVMQYLKEEYGICNELQIQKMNKEQRNLIFAAIHRRRWSQPVATTDRSRQKHNVKCIITNIWADRIVTCSPVS